MAQQLSSTTSRQAKPSQSLYKNTKKGEAKQVLKYLPDDVQRIVEGQYNMYHTVLFSPAQAKPGKF